MNRQSEKPYQKYKVNVYYFCHKVHQIINILINSGSQDLYPVLGKNKVSARIFLLIFQCSKKLLATYQKIALCNLFVHKLNFLMISKAKVIKNNESADSVKK